MSQEKGIHFAQTPSPRHPPTSSCFKLLDLLMLSGGGLGSFQWFVAFRHQLLCTSDFWTEMCGEGGDEGHLKGKCYLMVSKNSKEDPPQPQPLLILLLSKWHQVTSLPCTAGLRDFRVTREERKHLSSQAHCCRVCGTTG